MPRLDVLPYQSDAYVELDALTDAATGLVVNDATVTVTLYEKTTGVAVANAENLSAAYVASSNGKYRALVPRGAAVTLGGRYRCDVTATRGGLQMVFTQQIVVNRHDA